jgi:hypothetical protein
MATSTASPEGPSQADPPTASEIKRKLSLHTPPPPEKPVRESKSSSGGRDKVICLFLRGRVRVYARLFLPFSAQTRVTGGSLMHFPFSHGPTATRMARKLPKL